MKSLKSIHILMIFCAALMVYGFAAVINSTGIEAKTSILDISITFAPGDGPSKNEITNLPEDEKWGDGNHKLPAGPSCSNKNFTFYGWNDGSKTYAAGESYKIDMSNTSAITFSAVWGVPVTFDVNLSDTSENVTAPAEDTAVYKTDYKINTDKVLKATNYDFLGWSTETKKDATEPEYKAGDTIKGDLVTGPIKLYAIWKANFLAVRYYANTGSDTTDSAVSGMPTDATKYNGDNVSVTVMGAGNLASDNKNAATMTDGTPTRSGYTFGGWATTAAATTAEYQPGATFTITKDMDLYAVWTTGTTTAASSNKTTTTTPQTGDSDHFGLYIAIALLSLIGIGYLCYDQRKAKASK